MLSIEEIRAVFPEAKETANEKEVNCHCPHPHKKGTRNYKLYINRETGMYYCQDCGAAGDALAEWFDFVSSALGNRPIPRPDTEPLFESKLIVRSLNEWADGVESPGRMTRVDDLPDGHAAKEYCRDRKILNHPMLSGMDSLMYCEGGGFTPLTKGRIIFPVTVAGKLVGWTSRYIDRRIHENLRERWDGDRWVKAKRNKLGRWSDSRLPKYYALPGWKKSMALYMRDKALDYEVAILVEGTTDVLRVGPPAMGYFQTAPSDYQMSLVLNNWDRILWIPDPTLDLKDKRNFHQFSRAFNTMSQRASLKVMTLEGAEDPGSADETEIWKQIHKKLKEKW